MNFAAKNLKNMKKMSATAISGASMLALLLGLFPTNAAMAYSGYFDLYQNNSARVAGSAAGQARFNTDAQDKPTLRVSNYTQNPNSTNSWSTSLSGVHAGDVVSFVIYYHNTSNVNAVDTRASLAFSNITSSGAMNVTATGKIWAQNAAAVSGVANIYFAEPINDLSLLFQSAFWYPNQNSASAQSLPFGQSGSQIASAQGISLGNIAPGWNTQGYVVARFKVNGTPVSTNSSLNDASCVSVTAPNTVTAGQTFTATVVMRNTGTKVWNSDSTPHRLGSQNPQDTLRWGISRVNLPGTVNSGQDATFTFTATAPNTPGSYPFDWKMVEENVAWFGGTCTKTITVTSATNELDFSLSVSPSATQTTTKPAQLTYTVYVDQVNGYGNQVTLSFIPNASGISGTFAQNQVWPGGYTTLTVTIPSYMSDGNYSPVIRGTMGSRVRDLTLNISVYSYSGNQATLSISPGYQTAGVNGTAQYTAYYDPDGAGYQGAQNVTSQALWSSYQSNIASPTSVRGQFIGNASGAATIAASYAGLTATATMSVSGGNTSGLAPVVSTKPATIIARTSALLNGEVNPNGAPTDVWFEYGTTPTLDSETNFQTYGASTSNLPVAYALLTLAPNTTYYFRAVAENDYGISYGEILSFRTLAAAAPAPAPAPAPVTNTTTVVVAGDADLCVKLVPSTEAPEVKAGESFDYYLIFRNECAFALKNVVLSVTLPEEADLVSTNYPFTKNGNTLTYKLDSLERNYQGTIVIRNVLNREEMRAKNADMVLYTATMNYADNKGRTQSISAFLNVAVDTTSFLGLAALIAIFSSLGWWWLWVIVLALVGYFLYRLWKRYREGQFPVAIPGQFRG